MAATRRRCRPCHAAHLAIAISLAALCSAAALADDWPTVRHDNARSGWTTETVEPPLRLRWAFRQKYPPQQAWSGPRDEAVEGNWEKDRIAFDVVNHVAVADGSVFMGSSGDGTVYCLDAETGRIRWSFITGGPVRLAPAVANGRVYFGSDDGHAYCVSADDGSLVWRLQAGPEDDRLIGNGWMVSRWPVRSGVLVDDGTAYFGAGVFPHEGVYVWAADADDGRLIWRNDTTSTAAERGLLGGPGSNELSPHGYLLASQSRLFVASGRALPAAFDREDGRKLYQSHDSWRSSGIVGGTFAVLADDHILVGANQAVGYDQESGRGGFAWFPCRRLVVADELAYMTTDAVPTETSGSPLTEEVTCVSFEPYAEATRERKTTQRQITSLERQHSDTQGRLRAERAKPEGEQDAERIAELAEQVEETEAKLEAARERLEEIEGRTLQAQVRWRTPTSCASSLILAGDVLYAGGEGLVVGYDAGSGDEVWRAEVDGDARGLAAADGALYVSTDAGLLYCFAPGDGEPGPMLEQTADGGVYGEDEPMSAVYRAAAEAIVSSSGVRRGFCLVLGVETGRLAYELARRTDLKIYCLEADAERVQTARAALSAAGVHGGRVFVDQGDTSDIPYPDYFANLIVSESALHGRALPEVTEEIIRTLKPCGGVVCVGRPENAPAALTAERLTGWLRSFNCGEPSVSRDAGLWGTIVRGALPGAGSWTHQYAEPGNTAGGDDDIRCPLGLLWYGDPGPDKMLSRHARSVAPLTVDGRLLMQGNNVVMCYDAYNGVRYWERQIEGAVRSGMTHRASNTCCNSRHMFVAVGPQCLRLDVSTGETTATFEQPDAAADEPPAWGWIATVGDLLYGSTSLDGQFSAGVFALDAESGDPRWVYEGTRIKDNTIAIGDGRMFFADSVELTDQQRREAVAESGGDPDSADVRMVVCLDAATGDTLWERPVDLTDCGGASNVLMAMYRDGVLVFSAAHWNGHYWGQFLGGDYGERRAVALAAQDGELLWHKRIGYRIRPLIVGEQFVAEPWAFDLHTGEQRMRAHPITGEQVPWQFERPGHHCGCISGADNLLLFRSSFMGYYDLVEDYGTCHFGALRPGCWINAIPASGLVVMPEASSGCQCLYAIQCTVVFQPVDKPRTWGIFSTPGPHRPVTHLAVNLGAPGDRRAADGKLWLSYPRPWSRMQTQFELKPTLHEGGGYVSDDPRLAAIEGAATPWLHTSGLRGLRRLEVPLVQRGDAPAAYRVRLHLLAPPEGEGQPPVDIRLQGETVAEGLDVRQAAGGPSRPLVREFDPVPVRGELQIEFAPRVEEPAADSVPLLSAVELERVSLPGMDAQVQTLRRPLARHNLGYWLAEVLRQAADADMALIPCDSVWLEGDRVEAGTLTLGELLAHVTDARLVRHRVTGAELLEYLSNPRVADRLNPLSHGRASQELNSLYHAGLEVTYDADRRSVRLDLDPGRQYALVSVCPFAGLGGRAQALDAEAAAEHSAIPGLRSEAAEVLELTTWSVLESLGAEGLSLTRRYPEALAIWETWLEHAEEQMGYHLTEWPEDLPAVTIEAAADASVRHAQPNGTMGSGATVTVDGGDRELGDGSHTLIYLRFPLDVPGRPVMAKLRLRTHDGGHANSAEAGDVRVVEEPWEETTVTYKARPSPGEKVGALGAVELGQVSEHLLKVDLRARDELSLGIVPTSCDAAVFLARESGDGPELIVAYQPQ